MHGGISSYVLHSYNYFTLTQAQLNLFQKWLLGISKVMLTYKWDLFYPAHAEDPIPIIKNFMLPSK